MGATEEKYFCIICEKRLFSAPGEAACSFCGKSENADYICPDGHCRSSQEHLITI